MIGTVLQIIGAGHSYLSSRDAARRVQEAGEKNAQLAELETAEQVRRYEYQLKQEQANRVVAIAKSGVAMEGTPLTVMAEAANVADREVAFLQEQGRRTAAARRAGAATQASSLRSQGTSLLIDNVNTIGQENNWWDIT
jgi:hypothetical protein